MLIATGIVALLFGIVYAGQLVSVVNMPLAQRLGLQERPSAADPLFTRLEANTARWDLAVLWTMPATGVLMLWGHPAWPFAALVAGGVYIDAAGREAAKWLGLRAARVGVGTPREGRLYLAAMAAMAAAGLLVIGVALGALA